MSKTNFPGLKHLPIPIELIDQLIDEFKPYHRTAETSIDMIRFSDGQQSVIEKLKMLVEDVRMGSEDKE